jgi:hypothetical protein
MSRTPQLLFLTFVATLLFPLILGLNILVELPMSGIGIALFALLFASWPITLAIVFGANLVLLIYLAQYTNPEAFNKSLNRVRVAIPALFVLATGASIYPSERSIAASLYMPALGVPGIILYTYLWGKVAHDLTAVRSPH